MMGYLFKFILFLIVRHTYGITLFELGEIVTPSYISAKVQEFLRIRSDVSISQCGKQLEIFAKALGDGELWSLKMIDASGKLASGILEGNVDMGSYDECIGIDGTSSNGVMGRYCLGNIAVELPNILLNFSSISGVNNLLINNSVATKSDTIQIGLRHALCIPDACSHNVLNIFFETLNIKTDFSKEFCQTKINQYDLDGASIAGIAFFGILFGVVLLSTFYDYYHFYTQKESQYVILSSFSIITNGKKLLRRSWNPDVISCLHGMRVLSTIWIILHHTYTVRARFPIKNILYGLEWIQKTSSTLVLYAGLSVDTFFVMGGITLTYTYLLSRRKGKKFNVLLFYIHRLFRLTPVLAFVVILYLTLLKHMGSGPVWPQVVKSSVESCEKNWWRTMLYINNYGKMIHCFQESWYLSVDMQLYLLSPIILIPLNIWPKLTLIGTGVLTACSMAACFVISWEYDLTVQIVNLDNILAPIDYMMKYYFPAYTRASAWLIGILYGYLIYNINEKNCKFLFHKGLIGLLWIISLAVLCTCVFAGHDLISSFRNNSKIENSFFLTFVRPAWATVVGWIIFACFNGYGGPINLFLSSGIFEVLGKLSYTMYMLHMTVLLTYFGQTRSPAYFSDFEQHKTLWGILGFSLIFATIIHITIECPFIAIEQWIFGGKKGTVKKSVHAQEIDTNTNASKQS